MSATFLAQRLRPLLVTSRAAEWWEYKFVPIFALFYATGVMLDAPLTTLWPQILILLLALVPGAVYVSVLNDLTDRDEDLAAGKTNRLVGRSTGTVAALLALPLAVGAGVMFMWRQDLVILCLYAAAWLSFTLYSVRPFRLKTRGLAGVLADAGGAHLFPSLLAVVLTFRAVDHPLDLRWFSATGLWALAYGLRGILWHQLSDVANDRAAGVRTFAERHSGSRVAAVAKYLVFPVELFGLTLLLMQLHAPIVLAGLAAYSSMVAAKVYAWNMHVTIVDSPPRFVLVLHEYYDVFLPLSILTVAVLHNTEDLIVLAVHLVLFPRRVLNVSDQAVRLLAIPLRRSARAVTLLLR